MQVSIAGAEREGDKQSVFSIFSNMKNAVVGVVQDLTPISFQVIDYAHAIHQLFEKTYFIEKLLIDLEQSQ
jgi:predicted ATP-grasp superfamily ATP-dependent carboligase